MSKAPSISQRFIEKFALQPDYGRALRTALAFGIPLIVFHAMRRPVDAMFVAFTAQIIGMQDLRGAYGVRLAILLTMIMVSVSAIMLGVVSGGSIVAAVFAMGLIAIMSGVWRQLSADYGPPMAVSSALLFLFGTIRPGDIHAALHLAGFVLVGGIFATLLHMGFWFFHPQHPLRYAVAETWVAASDLIAAMRPAPAGADAATAAAHDTSAVEACERDLRTALDRTFLILDAAETRHQSSIIDHLEEMRREVVHFSMRIIAFNIALEPLRALPDFAKEMPVVDSVLKTLGDAARSTAITLITHRPENYAASAIRLRRSIDLIRVLDQQLAVHSGDIAILQLRAALAETGKAIPLIAEKLASTIDHTPVRSSFPQMLPELGARSIRSLSAWVNPSPRLDPVLLRYSLRMAVVTMLATALYKSFDYSHLFDHFPGLGNRGYWIVFTIIVVLQPDYGSTRDRAFQRIGGTLAGILLGSALLWIKMPVWLLDIFSIITSFCFAFFIRRRYGVGIFFVTLLIVLITETMMPVNLPFTIARFVCTLIGGLMALVAALVFWPVWEGRKFPALLSAALRANVTFLESMSPWFHLSTSAESEAAPPASGSAASPAPADPLMERRRAENANRFAAESLKRLTAEPAGRDESADAVARSAALATYSQRITRAFTAVAVHAGAGVTLRANSRIPALMHDIESSLEILARLVDEESRIPKFLVAELNATFTRIQASLDAVHILPANDDPDTLTRTSLIWTQLAKAIAEIRAMALVLQS